MARLSPADMPQLGPTPETTPAHGERCDADCPAEAQVRLIRDPDGELAFCQHHFREHAPALKAGGWREVGSAPSATPGQAAAGP